MKILVFGANGYIGKNAKAFFEKLGADVTGITRSKSNQDNVIISDYSRESLSSFFKSNDFDICLFASGSSNIPKSFESPIEDFNINTVLVFNILNSLRENQPQCKFINLSSAAVYGAMKESPIKESHPLTPISPYGWHKLHSENICLQFFKTYGLKTISLRVFSCYGPGLKKQFFWDLFNKANSGGDILLRGTGDESRDYIYIDDLLRAIDLVIKKGNFDGTNYNIANGKEVLIKNSSRIFIDKLDTQKLIRFTGKNNPGDPQNWLADIGKLNKLGFKEGVSLEDGLNRYALWAKEL